MDCGPWTIQKKRSLRSERLRQNQLSHFLPIDRFEKYHEGFRAPFTLSRRIITVKMIIRITQRDGVNINLKLSTSFSSVSGFQNAAVLMPWGEGQNHAKNFRKVEGTKRQYHTVNLVFKLSTATENRHLPSNKLTFFTQINFSFRENLCCQLPVTGWESCKVSHRCFESESSQ